MKKILVVLLLCITTQAFALMPGQEGSCRMNTAACATKDFFDEFSNAQVAGDKDGIMELFVFGKCFPVMKGDRVLVIESGWTTRKIRVKSGNYAGKAGWVYVEAVP